MLNKAVAVCENIFKKAESELTELEKEAKELICQAVHKLTGDDDCQTEAKPAESDVKADDTAAKEEGQQVS